MLTNSEGKVTNSSRCLVPNQPNDCRTEGTVLLWNSKILRTGPSRFLGWENNEISPTPGYKKGGLHTHTEGTKSVITGIIAVGMTTCLDCSSIRDFLWRSGSASGRQRQALGAAAAVAEN